MKEIKLCGKNGEGKIMLVDDGDYEKMNQLKWYWHNGYALAVKHISGSHSKNNIVQQNIVAHRYVLDLKAGDGIVVDHKNHNTLDNRRENLRLTNYKGNAWNTIRAKSNSGLTGVVKESVNCYKSAINYKTIGYYKTAKDAALAYDEQARKLHGEYAVLNFPEITDYSNIVKSAPHNKCERTSKVRGVSYSSCYTGKAKWRVVKNKQHLGWFLTEQDAIEFLERWLKANENQKQKIN